MHEAHHVGGMAQKLLAQEPIALIADPRVEIAARRSDVGWRPLRS